MKNMNLIIEMVPHGDIKRELKEDEYMVVEAAHVWLEENSKDKVFKDYTEVQDLLKKGLEYIQQKGLGKYHTLRLVLTPGKHDHIEFNIGEKPENQRVAIIANVSEAPKEGKKA